MGDQRNKVICYHRKPRKMTFTPVNTRCPVNYTKLKSKRVTHCINLETGAIMECVDEWRCTHPHYCPFGSESNNVIWTGWTQFEIEDGSNSPAEEETRGGAKRKAEDEGNEERDRMPDRLDEAIEGAGVKRKAEDEGDEERTRRERRRG